MPYFSSTAIERAEYDRQTRVLSLWFRPSGGPYDHRDVDETIFQDLCAAASQGQYYNARIRDRYEVVPPR